LKNKKNQQGGTPVITMRVGESGGGSLMEAAAQEFIDAVHKKDIKGLKDSLRAILSMLKQKED